MTTHLNRLNEPIQMSGHNTWFHGEIRKLAKNTGLQKIDSASEGLTYKLDVSKAI